MHPPSSPLDPPLGLWPNVMSLRVLNQASLHQTVTRSKAFVMTRRLAVAAQGGIFASINSLCMCVFG